MSQVAQADQSAGSARSSLVNADGTTNRIWLQSYEPGVGADVDLSIYESINQYFDECINKFRTRVAYVS